MVPPGHAQAPVTHEVPVGHALPQVPQLALSVLRLTQRPAQSVVPVGHAQRPAAHTWPVVQTLPAGRVPRAVAQ